MKPIIDYQLQRAPIEVINEFGDILLAKIGNRSGIYILHKGKDIYYVGKAKSLDKRLKQHFEDKHKNKWDSFSVYVLDERNIHFLERLLIGLLKPTGNSILYDRELKRSTKDLKKEILLFQKVQVEKLFQPDDLPTEQKNISMETSETKALQKSFWRAFNAYAKAHGASFSLQAPQARHWHNVSIGKSGVKMALTATTASGGKQSVSCQIYIHKNKKLFVWLLDNKKEIEKELGIKLDWQALDGKKASRIKISKAINYKDKKNREKCFKFLFKTLKQFHKVFPKYLKSFR